MLRARLAKAKRACSPLKQGVSSMSELYETGRALKRLIRILMIGFKPSLGDLIGPLVHADEIRKLVPRLQNASVLPIDVLRQRVQMDYGDDLVGAILAAQCFGGHTIESHARSVVRGYAATCTSDAWADELMAEALKASQIATRAYL